MFKWLFNKIFKLKREQWKRAHDVGLRRGFELGCQYEGNKGIITGTIADRQIEEILKEKGV